MTVAEWAVIVLVQVTVVIGLAALFAWPARSRPAVRHAVWLAALVCVLLSPVLATVAEWAGMHVTIPVRATASMPVAEVPILPVTTSLVTVVKAAPETQKLPVFSPIGAPSPEHSAGEPVAAPLPVVPIDRGPVAVNVALSVWLLGTLLLFCRLLLGVRTVARLRRLAQPVDPALIATVAGEVCQSLGGPLPAVAEAPAATVPLALGVIRPVVLLPAGLAASLPAAQLRDVLIHEAAHLWRRDPLVGLLQRLAAALIWPHPLVHWLNRRLARTREEVCDNYVLSRGRPADYARTLLALAERIGPPRPVPALALFDAGWRLEHRIAGLLAPGRMTMTRTNRWLRAGIVGVLLAVGLLVAGVRFGAAALPPTAPDDPTKAHVSGDVVDEAGKPVQGAKVRLLGEWSSGGRTATTAADGRFHLSSERAAVNWECVLAEVDGSARLGFFEVKGGGDIAAVDDVRVVVRPGRRLLVRVVDGEGRPVPKATVAVLRRSVGTLARGETDLDGTAHLQLPAGAGVRTVVAAKPGIGFDYFENFQSWPPPTDARPEPPAEVRLVLNGARTARVRAVDAVNKPVTEVELYPLTVQKSGKLSYVNMSGLPFGPAFRLKTDASGQAVCDWLPADLTEAVEFDGSDRDYFTKRGPEPIPYDPDHPEKPATVRLHRIDSELTGHVTRPNGLPAGGIAVGANSYGDGWDQAGGTAHTAADGTYRIKLPPGFTYAVGVFDRDWAAPTHIGVEILPGQSVTPIDFRLSTGTLIQGRVTAGNPPGPLADQRVIVAEFDPATRGPNRPRIGNRFEQTDADGRYSVRVGPGEYEINVSMRRDFPSTVRVTSQSQVTENFHFDAPTLVPFNGMVRGPTGEPVADAVVLSETLEHTGRRSPHTTTDGRGRFSFERQQLAMMIYSQSPAGDLAGTVRIGADDKSTTVTLSPAATASGRIVDSAGQPRAATRVQVSLIFMNDRELAQFTWFRTTDASGKFSLAGIPDGARCVVRSASGIRHGQLAQVTIRGTGTVDLGDLKLPDMP